MQNRINRLEGLVLSLMTNGAQSAGPAAAAAAVSRSQSDSTGSSYPPDLEQDDDNMIKEEGEDEDDESEVDGVTNSLGILKVDADQGNSMYFGDSHWHMVLADVSSKFYTTVYHNLSCPSKSVLHCGGKLSVNCYPLFRRVYAKLSCGTKPAYLIPLPYNSGF